MGCDERDAVLRNLVACLKFLAPGVSPDRSCFWLLVVLLLRGEAVGIASELSRRRVVEGPATELAEAVTRRRFTGVSFSPVSLFVVNLELIILRGTSSVQQQGVCC